jgi:hypothetical protein
MNKIVALVTFLFVWSLTTHGKYSATGDEPHYLMITQSVVADHDLDLANNYANDEGRLFGHDHLVMGPHARADRQGRVASVHDIGLPLLLVGPYVTARWIADRAPVDTLALLYVPMASFVEWWGGFAPAGRYLVPILPLCLMPVAASLRSRAIAVLVIVLAVPQVMIDAICWQHPRFLWPAADRVNPLLTSLGPAGRAYLRVLLQLRGFDG